MMPETVSAKLYAHADRDHRELVVAAALVGLGLVSIGWAITHLAGVLASALGPLARRAA